MIDKLEMEILSNTKNTKVEHDNLIASKEELSIKSFGSEDTSVSTIEDLSHLSIGSSNKKIMVSDRKNSTQMDIFMNQFIKPEIKNKNLIIKSNLKRRASTKQTSLNLLIIGEKGLGKNTFIQSLVNSCVSGEGEVHAKDNKEKMIGVGISEKKFSFIKDGQKINLNIIKIPEYGCGMQSDSTFSNLLDYVDTVYEECFKLECSLDRTSTIDQKIHCCLYFLSPYGHGMKPLDINFMKLFQSKINIIPIIAKSDIFTKTELDHFKMNVLKDFETHGIQLFDYFSNSEGNDDGIDEFQDMCEDLKIRIPFTVISSDDVIINNQKVSERVRQYPWGVLKTSDKEISNYTFLETILLKSHVNYFKNITKSIHYENFRVQYILDHVN